MRDLVPFLQFKKRKKHPRILILLVKLQDLAYYFTKSNTPPWVFFTFLKLYKGYQIAQSITYELSELCENLFYLFHDRNICHVETIQWIGFSMVGTTVVKEFKHFAFLTRD